MNQPFESVVLILVVHLLDDVQGFIRTLLALGAHPDRLVVLNIPYSTKSSALSALWLAGVRNLYISAAYPSTELLGAIDHAERLARANEMPILVIEDGGYIGPHFHRERPDLLAMTVGIVEQTQNGIWQYESGSGELLEPGVPVVKVAECRLKKTLESPLIGQAIRRNIEDLLATDGVGLHDRPTLLFGYGATGREAAKELAHATSDRLEVYDQDDDRRDEARNDGFVVPDDLEAACERAFLLVGCTGRVSIQTDHLLRLRGESYFANGSSKRAELDWATLPDIQEASRTESVGTVATIRGGAQLTILADGYPVNFFGNSVPDEEISFIYGLLVKSAVWIMEARPAAGWHDVPASIQDEVEADHTRIRTERFHPETTS